MDLGADIYALGSTSRVFMRWVRPVEAEWFELTRVFHEARGIHRHRKKNVDHGETNEPGWTFELRNYGGLC